MELVDILVFIHFALIIILLVILGIAVGRKRISKTSAFRLGAITLICAIIPQLIIRMTGAWQKVEYYFVYGVTILILLWIGILVRGKYRKANNQDA